MNKLFIMDTCSRLHSQQFGFYCPDFPQYVKLAMNRTGVKVKFLNGEYHGLFVNNTGGDKEVLYNQGPFSSATRQPKNCLDTLKPETIFGFEKCISSTGKINYDYLIVLTASAEMTENIISDDFFDIKKHTIHSGFNIFIYSFWDFLIAVIHHSKFSLPHCLSVADNLKKEGFSRFSTKFWESERIIFDRCIFCDNDITQHVREFKQKN